MSSRLRPERRPRLRAAAVAPALALALISGTGCAHGTVRCAAADLTPSPAEMARIDLPALRCLVEDDRPSAMLELAKRLEAGRDMPVDLAAAAYWYGRAAGIVQPLGPNSVPTIWANGRLLTALAPAELRGVPSAEARYRLGQMYLDGRGVKRDPARGARLIETARARGYSPR